MSDEMKIPPLPGVNRFACGPVVMADCIDGSFVRYTDYAALQQQLAACRGKCAELVSDIEEGARERISLAKVLRSLDQELAAAREACDAWERTAEERLEALCEAEEGADILRNWVIHNGGLLNEWAKEWNPSIIPLTAYIGKRLDAAIDATLQRDRQP